MSLQSDSVGQQILFVDLDGTLIATDLVWKSLFLLLTTRPLSALKIPFWFMAGRPLLKRKMAERISLAVDRLPFRPQVLDFLRAQRAGGCRLVLATASTTVLARQVARHLGLFDDCLATEAGPNLKGAAKADRIEAYCREHRFRSFGYVGDSWADLAVWSRAARVYLVAPSAALRSAVMKLGKPTEVLVERSPPGSKR